MGATVNWMDSVGKESTLWQAMLQSPNFWVEGSLPLRPQLNNQYINLTNQYPEDPLYTLSLRRASGLSLFQVERKKSSIGTHEL